ncbi:serpin family protein [uncultured Algimonas sp.]|uniref:serpin family protein n=1 Tax=uncultured Algimonas sp. TaxID=1547920 RepID=UPI002623C4CC|nr:serpin family protein [uncultured Algimonas sp.]
MMRSGLKYSLKYPLAASALAGLAGCATVTQTPPAPVPAPVPALATDNVADASLDFGVRLMDTVRVQADDSDETVLLSPVSLSTAFGLLYVGSEGDTQAQIRDVMGFGSETDAFATELGGLATAVERDTVEPYADGRRTIVDINNAVFLDRSLNYTPGYLDRIDAAYDATLESVSFLTDLTGAVDAINDWVNTATRGLIPKVYGYKDLTTLTSDVLVNTIYMKAAWPGELDETTGPFRATGGTRDVPRVADRGDYAYLDRDGYRALLIPFSDRELAAVAVLPDRDLDRVAARLDGAGLADLLDDLETQPNEARTFVDLELPKLALTGSYKMRDPLLEMGMTVPFDSDLSDFDGRLDPDLQSRRNAMGFVVGNVTHKTRLDLDEIGVEAAAVTAIDSVIVTGSRIRVKPVEFHVDRPFLFLLIHRPTGAPLFLARVTDPGEVD